jgi:archaemetzincin
MAMMCFKILFIFIFILLIANCGGKEDKMYFIYLQPIGEIDTKILQDIKSHIEKEFKVEVKIAKPIELPNNAYNLKRRQYHSTTILYKLEEIFPLDADRILGIVDVDLYVPQLNFVFGEANTVTKVAIISLCRLHQEYYGLPEDNEIFTLRTIKEAVHELGHTYGLRHCKDIRCVMHFSNSLIDTDNKSYNFCDSCLDKLKKE